MVQQENSTPIPIVIQKETNLPNLPSPTDTTPPVPETLIPTPVVQPTFEPSIMQNDCDEPLAHSPPPIRRSKREKNLPPRYECFDTTK